MKNNNILILKNALDQKKAELILFQETYGEKPAGQYESYKNLKTILLKPEPTFKYQFVLRDIAEIAETIDLEFRKFNFNSRKLSKSAQNALHKRKEREIKERGEITKLQISNAKIISNAVFKSFWGNSAKLLKFISDKKQKLKQKKNQEKKMNHFLKVQMDLADEILNEIKMQTDRLSLQSHVERTSKQKSLVINLKKIGKRQYKFLGIEKKQSRKPANNSDKNCENSNAVGSLFTGKLRDYQQIGVSWLGALAMKRISCILADEMGLGKTVQTIAYLANLAEKEQVWGPHLIIVPTTVLGNWLEEFERFLPSFKVFAYFGRSCDRKLKRKGWSELEKFNVCITTYRIISIDSKIFKRRKWFSLILDEAHLIKNSKTLSFMSLHRLRTFNRILLTGTPLQNRLNELWTLMTFIFPKKFANREGFCSNFDFYLEKAAKNNQTMYNNIIQKLHTILRPLILRRLKKDVEKQMPKKIEKIIYCDFSRRQQYLYDQFLMNSTKQEKKNANFMQSLNVLMQLRKICNHPDLMDEKISVLPLVLQKIEFFLPRFLIFNPEIDGDARKTGLFLQQPHTSPVFLASMICLLHYKYKLEVVSGKSNRNKSFNKYLDNLQGLLWSTKRSQDFSLLNTFFSNKLKLTPSNQPLITVFKSIEKMSEHVEKNYFHFFFQVKKCESLGFKTNLLYEPVLITSINKWAYQNTITPLPKIFVSNINNFINDSGKMKQLYHLLMRLRKENKKILIFTQMSKMLNYLETFLSSKGFTYVRMDGTTYTEKRQEIVKRFSENPKIMIFISSTRVGGIGINLTVADTVIFFDCDWNPAVDKQAQDRCHRIGQSRDVTVYKLITRSSIEENILMTSNVKSKIDDMVLNKGRFNLQTIFQKIIPNTQDSGIDNPTEYNRIITGYLSLVEEDNDKVPDELITDDNQFMNPDGLTNEFREQGFGFKKTIEENQKDEGGSFRDTIHESENEIKLTESLILPVFKFGISVLEQICPNISKNQVDGLDDDYIPLDIISDKGSDEMDAESEVGSEEEDDDQKYYEAVLAKREMNLTLEEQSEIIKESRKKLKKELNLLK